MNMELLSLIGILIATIVFVVAVFKGYHIALVTIFSSIIVIIFSRAELIETMQDAFMVKMAATYKSYFLLFFFSALFAKTLSACGATQAIAYKLIRFSEKFKGNEKIAAVLCVAGMQAAFTMGGISLFVVIFTVADIARQLFKRVDVPWKFFAFVIIGGGTFTIGMMPGSPQLTNLIGMEYFGTSATAAPVLGILCSIFSLILSVIFVRHEVNKAQKQGEGFLPTGAEIMKSTEPGDYSEVKDIPLLKCLFPSIVLLIVLNILRANPVTALFSGILTTYVLFNPVTQFRNLKNAAITAVNHTNMSLIALATASGFGGVVASVSGFQYLLNTLDSIPGPATLQVFVAVNVAAGFTASSSTGQRLALDLFADKFMSYGIPNAALHRLVAISSCGLDTLPHSPALANQYSIAKLSHKDAYYYTFMISVLFNIFTAMFCMILISLGVTF